MSDGVKFTQGPWLQSHRERPDGMWGTQVYDAAGVTIATVAWYPVEMPGRLTATARDANARLIAAAPALYEALADILTIHDWCVQAGGAKGPLPQDVIHKFAEMQIPAIDKARAALKSAEVSQ